MFHKKLVFFSICQEIHFSTQHAPKDWSLKCFNNGKRSYKVLFPLRPNLWPQFRLGEICRERGLLACGCARNTQSPDVRLYLFLFHLSIGTCPLHPQISLTWSHYTTVYPFFREKKGSRCCVVFGEPIFQNFGSQLVASV